MSFEVFVWRDLCKKFEYVSFVIFNTRCKKIPPSRY